MRALSEMGVNGILGSVSAKDFDHWIQGWPGQNIFVSWRRASAHAAELKPDTLLW